MSPYGHTGPRLAESVAPKAGLSPEMETRLCTNSVYLHSSLLLHKGGKHREQAKLDSSPCLCPTDISV